MEKCDDPTSVYEQTEQTPEPLHLFEGYGVEMEYMLVKEPDLAVYPHVDKLLKKVGGELTGDFERDEIAWSNELVLHVLELKTNGPAPSLYGLANKFQENVTYINQILKAEQAMLMPTGAHPLMNPDTETKLWPHGCRDIYFAFNKIFDCRGHGWSNLQSTHLNLPFATDTEFAVLHTAIRLLLPLMPALSASTPIMDGKLTGMQDTRLQYYLTNQAKIPSITGHVVPEAIFSRADYEEFVLKRIYADIAPYDPDKILQFEWLNSRGAIARFDRHAIEIRILDIQENPRADLGIIALLVSTLRAITDERWSDFSSQAEWSEQGLSKIWRDVIQNGQSTIIQNSAYLGAFGFAGSSATVGELWQHIYTEIFNEYDEYELEVKKSIEWILEKGNLSERIIRRVRHDCSPEMIRDIYRELANCLAQGRLFE
ncbi:MAG: glutamate--cysteine ligase [Legionellales bacterium]|nr:glutamate--cysteine ligase [Legionellales bacterium]